MEARSLTLVVVVGHSVKNLLGEKNVLLTALSLTWGDAKLAKKKLRTVHAITAEDENLYKLFPEKYDVISFIDVIEHLAAPITVIKRIKPMLKEDGVILFSIPNMAHLSVRLALMKGEFTYTQTGLLDQTHLHFYTGDYIQRIFNDAGCEINVFNCSSYTYPRMQTNKILKSLGLQPEETFYKTMEDSHANVYQFVGTARKSANIKKTAVPKKNIHENDYKIIEDTINNYIVQAKELRKSITLKDQHISNLEAIIGEKSKELDRLNSKKVIKVMKKVSSAKARFKA